MKINYLIFLLLIIQCSSAQNTDSLKLLLRKAKHDTTKTNILNELSQYNDQLGNYNEAINNALLAQQLAEKCGYKIGLANAYFYMAWAYTNQGNYQKALESQLLSLKIKEEILDEKGIADSYNNIGVIYLEQGDYKQALHYLLKCLKIKEKINDTKGLATPLNNIGKLYYLLNYNDKARSYYLKSLKIKQEIGDKQGIASSYINIANIYLEEYKYDMAIDMYSKALKIAEEIADAKKMAMSYSNMGTIYEEQNNLQKALEYYLLALKVDSTTGDKKGMAISFYNVASIYLKQNNYEKSRYYINKSIELSKQNQFTECLKASFILLQKLYEKKNDYKQALKYYKLSVTIEDSLFNEAISQQIADMNAKHRYDKKSAVDSFKHASVLNEEKLQHAQAIKQQLMYTNVGIFGFACMFIMALMAFVAFKNKQKTNLIIEHQKQIIEQQKQEVEQQLLRTQMNPHFIFNTVSTLKALIFKNQTNDVGLYLDRFAALTRKILEYSEEKFISLHDEVEVLENYIALQKIIHGNAFNYKIMVDKNINTKNVMVPPMLAQPFVENTIKHGINKKNKDGLIEIQFEMKSDKLYLSIKDNGVGLADNHHTGDHKSMSTNITQRRLNLYLQNKDANISIKNQYDDLNNCVGTIVFFEVPFETKNFVDLDDD